MIKPTYVVGANGTPLPLVGGEKIVVIRPGSQGQKYSMCLTDSGRFVPLKGQRFGGVGVERYVKQQGFVESELDNRHAAILLDRIAAYQSIEYVEFESTKQAVRLQLAHAGQRVSYVPFDPMQAIQTADVSKPDGSTLRILGLGSGISCGCVSVEYHTDATRKCQLELANGWIVGADVDPSKAPRATAYGGIVERAAFVIANAGLAKVSGSMEISLEPKIDESFMRGKMQLTLTDLSGYIQIGITSTDELIVEYRRPDGDLICKRNGLIPLLRKELVLADAVGCIAGVIMQEQFMREAYSGIRKVASNAA